MSICIPNTTLPIDDRVLDLVQNSSTFGLDFDDKYLKMLPKIHGGVPVSPYFNLQNGEVRRIGWFVSYLDEQSFLPGSFQNAFYLPEGDLRIVDKSIPAVINDVISPYFSAERIFPFAALYTKSNSHPLNIRIYTSDSYPNDTLCFDRSFSPQRVVLCIGKMATKEALRIERDGIDEPDYDKFLEVVADDFDSFINMLRVNQ